MRARETSGNRLRPRPQSAPDTRLARVSENNHSHSRSWLRASNIPASEGVGHGKVLWPFHPKVEGHAEGVRQAVRRGEPSVLALRPAGQLDRKSTRLNSSHVANSYAVFCLQETHRND